MNKQKSKLSIIIPAYNEADSLPTILKCLVNQINEDKITIDPLLFQIIVVDNDSEDSTSKVVRAFQNKYKTSNCILIKEKTKGVIASRIRGVNYVLSRYNESSSFINYLAFCDSDVVVPSNWVNSIFQSFQQHKSDVISYAGSFPFEFWKKVPKLAQAYLREIGTIFFNTKTIEWLNATGKRFLFDERVFKDFIRPASGGCYAITLDAYLKAGGYKREFLDRQKKIEIDGPTWRLLFKLQMANAKISYINNVFFNCSPRRLLSDPLKFFKTNIYTQLNDLKNYRKINEKHYDKLKHLVEKIDFVPVKRYIIEYYILLPCIIQNHLIDKNKNYFGDFFEELKTKILNWRNNHLKIDGKDIFAFGKSLCDEYFYPILDIMRKQKD